jgi:hypothetical protein
MTLTQREYDWQLKNAIEALAYLEANEPNSELIPAIIDEIHALRHAHIRTDGDESDCRDSLNYF